MIISAPASLPAVRLDSPAFPGRPGPPPAMPSAAPSTAPSAAPAPALPPLQSRTPEQLKAGLVVEVKGAGSGDLAAARLIQDGAQYMARVAGTTMGLATVEVNYRAADSQGALGLATFKGNKGWFALSERSTKGIIEGIERLRTTPWASWTESQRQAFVQSNETILHESAHVTLNGYTSQDVNAWRGADRSFEEGLSEIATMTHVGDFLRDEFGIDIGSMTNRVSQSVSAYTRYTERITRMLEMGTDGSPEQLASISSFIGDKVRADQRIPEIAQRIGQNLGGSAAPAAIIKEIEKTLPGFISEQNGTRTKLMELQAALIDIKSGHQVDVDAVLTRARAWDAAARPGVAPAPTNGDGPLVGPMA